MAEAAIFLLGVVVGFAVAFVCFMAIAAEAARGATDKALKIARGIVRDG